MKSNLRIRPLVQHNFKVGDKVYLSHDMSFVGRAPSLIRITEVTKVGKRFVWVKGLEWANQPGKFNPDQRFYITSANVAHSPSREYLITRN